MAEPRSVPSGLSPEFLRRAVRFQASSDPDTATAQTAGIMAGLIHRSALDPLVRKAAREAVAKFRGGPLYAGLGRDPWADPFAMAESCWWWAKAWLRFEHHQKQLVLWFGERDQLQLLIEPAVLLRMRNMRGDCAIYSMAIAAMLEALGLDWELVALAVDPHQPRVYSHIFPRLALPDGRRLALDASHGTYAGWQVPREHTFRLQVFDDQGNPVADADRGRFSGLHDYRRAGRRQWRGLGQDAIDSYVDPSSYLGTPNTSTADWLMASEGLSTTPLSMPSSSDSSAWANAVTALTKAGMTLAEIQAIQPGTSVNPQTGQIVRQATGYPLQTVGTSLTASGISSVMWIGGAAVLALLLLNSMNRR